MNRAIKTLGWTLLVGVGLCLLLVAGIAALAGAFDAAPVIEINGDTVTFAQMGVGDSLAALVGIGVALLVVLLVVPVAVLVPLLLVAVLLVGVGAGVLLILAGAAALVCSPLILLVGVVWLIVRLARGGSGSKARAQAGATITG